MQLAFWRAGKKKGADEASVQPVRSSSSSAEPVASGDLDIRLIGRALARKRWFILLPTLFALGLAVTAVNMITPRYKSEARILIDGRENVFLRPNSERVEERQALDAEAVTSQVQLVLSRDLARDIIRKNKLNELPEFDSVLRGVSPLKSIAAMLGLVRDPLAMTPDERVMDAYYERLTVYAVDKSRVLVIEFQSQDPELAAQVANSIADGYLVVQQTARQAQAKSASQWLAGEIQSLRKKVEEAESRVEEFRAKSNSFMGTNNTSLSNQQMGETSTQLNNARALKSDAETKARLIREMLQSGQPIEASEVLNSELMRRLSEQRVNLRAQLAEQSSTLLDNHPRIKELKAQLADLDRQIRDEAGKISRSLDSDARIAEGRVQMLTQNLEQAKKQASSTNGEDVKLRALDREAKAQRDLLESYLAKYREANTRESLDTPPAEGRIISRAVVSNTPAYPKKLPIVLIATLATLMLTSGVVMTGELLRLTAPRATALGPITPVVVAVAPTARVEPVMAAPALSVAAPPPVTAPPVVAQPVTAQVAPPAPVAVAPPSAAGSPPAPEPVKPAPPPSTELDQLSASLLAAGEAARKITVLGTAGSEAVTATALSLARTLAREARVVLVDLAGRPQLLASLSVDPAAPGLIELMLGEATFASIITKDRASRLHLVNAGRPGADRNQLQSPRLALAIDALLRVYDHVLLDAGNASDLPAELLTTSARAVVVPDPAMPAEARSQMSEQLREVGFGAVTMLTAPLGGASLNQPDPRGVAA
ncbi:Putative Polysaccharide biosynthesis, transport Protein [Bradyrhizobium sp. ORS 285]|uniref:GumC family protein n=1 Tax=Bradyrhizobium sp. ORS 285 TaxID=115808 RepID=UPI0002408F1A|nr:exopolysaccharide transport family protein [Bradyrhizobium sp. ORS 285]CCD85715.1 putative Polysaccharide biosynthesis, transport Protein [Bradyrhizobium sp. ORS 285]SMX59028.1 Putative Polysaccharide biosynthesis, transport Protein [Bradyrhizobium sp. ORS 285]